MRCRGRPGTPSGGTLQRRPWAGLFLILPVAGRRTVLSILPTQCHLALGKGAGDDPKARASYGQIEPGKACAFRVKVLARDGEAAVAVRLNGERVIDWRGPQAKLPADARPWVLPDRKLAALGSNGTQAVIAALRVRMLTGTARRMLSVGN